MATTVQGDTRQAIISAAERLFAAQGIDGVSLREINRSAGQSNTGAVQYHFGNRDGLVLAVIAKHRRDTEPRRHALLDQYEDGEMRDIRALASALVAPAAAKLSDPDGGREYLQISAEFYTRSNRAGARSPELLPTDSITRWHRLLDDLVPSEEREVLHTRYPAIRFAFVELGRRAASEPREDDRLFVSHLTDLVASLLASTPSRATRRLLDQRSSAHPPAPADAG
jgi:AcrR family transcriptional regulator